MAEAVDGIWQLWTFLRLVWTTMTAKAHFSSQSRSEWREWIWEQHRRNDHTAWPYITRLTVSYANKPIMPRSVHLATRFSSRLCAPWPFSPYGVLKKELFIHLCVHTYSSRGRVCKIISYLIHDIARSSARVPSYQIFTQEWREKLH